MRRFTKGRLLATTCAFALGFSVPSDPAWYDPQEHDGISYDASIDSENGGHMVVKLPGQQPQHGFLTDFFNFQRNSVATYRGPGGIVKYANENLVLQSQTLDNVAWTASSVTVSPNVAIAPDGSLTAEAIVETAVTAPHFVVAFITKPAAVQTYTYTVHMKANTRTFGHMRLANGAGTADARCSFDLVNGIVGTPGTTGAGMVANSAAMTPVGNGWWRCSLVVTTDTDTGIQPVVGTATDLTTVYSFLGTITSSIFVWGAQVQRGPFYGKYLATVAAQKFDQPRVEWDQSINYNLALNSEDFTATASLHSQLGIITPVATDVAIAPNGTLTADKLVADTSTGGHRIRQATDITIPVGSPVSYSVHVKAAGRTKAMILVTESTFASTAEYVFDLVSGSIGLIGVAGTASGASAFMTDVGNGWWRIGVTVTIGGAFSSVRALTEMCSTDGTANAFTGDGVSGLLVWGEQLTTTSTHLPYIKAGATSTFGSYNESCRGFLAETTRTNLLLQSQDLNTTWTTSNSTMSANFGVAPDGSLTADKLVSNNATLDMYVTQATTLAATSVYTLSVWAKYLPGEAQFIMLRSDVDGGSITGFDIANGTIVGTQAPWFNSRIEAYGNGWYRCSASYTTVGTAYSFRIYIDNTGNAGSFTGNGVKGVLLWGAQLELGGAASSYIPTFTTTVTRAADTCDHTLGSEYTQSVGTLTLEGTFSFASEPAAPQRFVTIWDGTDNNRTHLARPAASNVLRYSVQNAAVNSTTLDFTPTNGGKFKAAVEWAPSDFNYTLNGQAPSNATAGNNAAPVSPTTISFAPGVQQANGNILRVDYYANERKVNSILQTLSTL